MAGTTTWRVRALTVAVAAVTALGLAACGKDAAPGNTSPTGTSGGDSAIGGAPSADPTATATAGSGGGSGGGGGGTANTPVYPKDPKAYVQELQKAMAKPDYTRLNQLAIQSAVQQIKDSITAGGNPNSQWPYLNCIANTGNNQATCVSRNSHGDEMTVKLNQSQLGFPTAVTEAQLIRTEYPNDPGSYASAFLNAWQQGNQQRMARLSSDSAKTFFMGQGTPLQAYTQGAPQAAGSGFVTIEYSGLSGDSGRYYTMKVVSSPGGKANSIKGYCMGSGCTIS